jgi:hypothetical protein
MLFKPRFEEEGVDVLRGRVFQIGAAVSMALLGLLAVALGWAAIQYRQFSADISQSRSRLPASVDRALPTAPPGALDAPEVTLVRYTSALSTGGSVLFFTDPKRHLMSFLALPPSTRIGSQSLARFDVPTTIAALRTSTAVRVDHVALRPVRHRKPRVRPGRHHHHQPGRRAGGPA